MILERLIDLDTFLLDRVYQPIVDALSRWWGLHFVTVGEFLMTGAFVCWIAGGLTLVDGTRTGIIIGSVWVFGTVIILWILYPTVDRAKKQKDGFVNPMRYELFVTRVGYFFNTFIYFLPPYRGDAHEFLMDCFAILLFSGLYVLSCQTGPPRQRRRAPSLAPLEAEGSA